MGLRLLVERALRSTSEASWMSSGLGAVSEREGDAVEERRTQTRHRQFLFWLLIEPRIVAFSYAPGDPSHEGF